MVHDQLRQLLLEHDCVTLPGFGALLAEPVPARIHPVRHTLSPPARRVAFSDRLRHDDGLLTEAVRLSLAVAERDSAPAQVRSFTEELRAALRQHRAAELRGLGTLRQPADGDSIRFEAMEPGYLPLADSFGLPELVSRPIVLAERTRATRYVPETNPADQQLRPSTPARLRRLVGEGGTPLYRLALTAVAILSLSATYFNFRLTPLANRFLPGIEVAAQDASTPQRAAVGSEGTTKMAMPIAAIPLEVAELAAVAPLQAATVTRKKSPSPDALHEVALAVPAPKPAAVTPSEIVAAPATPAAFEPATVRAAPTNRYYLVWNAFTTKVKAEKGRAQVLKLTPADAANAPSVLTPPRGSVLYRVAVADFATQAEAVAAQPALRARYGPALWVLKY